MNKPFWKLNENIRANEVRLIGRDGKQIGVVSIREALEAAKKEKLDLIEIAPNAKPVVVKIADFGKFRYQEEKRFKKENKKAKPAELKEIRFSPFMGKADFETRKSRVKQFLEDGNKVKIVVVFKGRHMGKTDFGYKLIEKLIVEFRERIVVDMAPKMLGRHLSAIISPVKKKVAKNAEAKNTQVNN
ncbi:translation initiation factor IF-3 [Candidatus Woesebacteria bacterium RIFCSPHIGHO2_02_FULL_42_20]|uniref:Translation initiation factor IF-3 n=1 Tax=Candidatus Woesebacteria bacterium RIFCSPHIGHO2_12_FULL_41_24 TaxID=1802510 RepID=A0A1F8ARH1_9BACT|nr:MAG: translation initiation factor IF-3 [Candidatus Woesebacteria bacterium RBG_16_41_13]OGM30928.1 MAG: translation initiation factor IF-3 [Candidatus Woesebacteria bacterium RIFCSPHIGHO2_01_FULL_42_80]OGM35897.1 MAG: translation initiation factor IF-3 [Candidatus Woesebacteria bacterium RIFCSPHIGHO2_02_FULL_42_20]OGM54210.1 MAG: translation initiation factor IF-3 [Candidatus Woesebacteria bacterium RIFCSPHIGHO2_12_FULL_41_24]OGM66147.1 MAG: translation initiation factor IF-3 [Candidatus Wo